MEDYLNFILYCISYTIFTIISMYINSKNNKNINEIVK